MILSLFGRINLKSAIALIIVCSLGLGWVSVGHAQDNDLGMCEILDDDDIGFKATNNTAVNIRNACYYTNNKRVYITRIESSCYFIEKQVVFYVLIYVTKVKNIVALGY